MVFFFYSESYNGQCKCAVDDCSNPAPGPGDNIYKVDPGAPLTGLDITLNFEDVGLTSDEPMDVLDIWTGKVLRLVQNNYTAKKVAFHGTAFLRISRSQSDRRHEQIVV